MTNHDGEEGTHSRGEGENGRAEKWANRKWARQYKEPSEGKLALFAQGLRFKIIYLLEFRYSLCFTFELCLRAAERNRSDIKAIAKTHPAEMPMIYVS